jgi:hypothetical protein
MRTEQYSSADAYPTAVLEWEAWSVVDRAIVAAELNIGTDWIAALGRDFKAGKIIRGQMLNRVVARLAEFVTQIRPVDRSLRREIPPPVGKRAQT